MHNVWLIAKREYLERVRTKAFLIATILIPVLLGGLGFGSGYLAQRTKSSAHIAILSADPVFAADLKHELQEGKDSNMLVDLDPLDDATRTRLESELKDSHNSLAGYLQVIPPPIVGDRPTFTYSARSASDIGTTPHSRSPSKPSSPASTSPAAASARPT